MTETSNKVVNIPAVIEEKRAEELKQRMEEYRSSAVPPQPPDSELVPPKYRNLEEKETIPL